MYSIYKDCKYSEEVDLVTATDHGYCDFLSTLWSLFRNLLQIFLDLFNYRWSMR